MYEVDLFFRLYVVNVLQNKGCVTSVDSFVDSFSGLWKGILKLISQNMLLTGNPECLYIHILGTAGYRIHGQMPSKISNLFPNHDTLPLKVKGLQERRI